MARLRESNAAKAGAFAALVAGMVVVAAVGGGSANPLQVLAAVLLLSPVWMLALAGFLLLHARLDRRAIGGSRRTLGTGRRSRAVLVPLALDAAVHSGPSRCLQSEI